MDDVVMVQIPVTRAAAEALADQGRRQRVGRIVSDMVRPQSPEQDPLAKLFADVKRDARRNGLTNDAIDSELAAYNAERRL